MAIIPGHVLVLKLPFADGAPCIKPRTFLVIDNNDSTLDLLNVSSTIGKERKLLFPSNKRIEVYNPPLDYPSFVKLDSLYTIEYFEDLHKSIYKRRPPLDSNELSGLTDEYLKYKERHGVTSVKYVEAFVRQENTL